MRRAARVVLVARVMFCVVVVAGLATGCGNSSVICADTTKTLEGFAATAKALPPSDTARWRRAIIDVANRLDALARRADDDELAKALVSTARSRAHREDPKSLTGRSLVASVMNTRQTWAGSTPPKTE